MKRNIFIYTSLLFLALSLFNAKIALGRDCFESEAGCGPIRDSDGRGWMWTCFPAGTKILMSDKSEKNIEDVRVGDSVMGYDLNGKKMSSSTVQELDTPIRDHLYKLTFSDGTTLRLTSEHPLYTKAGWKSIDPVKSLQDNPSLPVQKLQIGDVVFNSKGKYTKLVSMLYIPGNVQTYNLKKVTNYNNFFADSYLAHNKGGDDDGGGGGGGGTTTTTAVVAAPTATPVPVVCTTKPVFAKASVAPSTVRPLDQVTVKCDYGPKYDCISVSGAGLTNCRYSRYEGTEHIFTCDAKEGGAGFYDDTKCIVSAGTAGKCCAATNKAGDIKIVDSEVRYGQGIVLPFGTYTLSARVFSVISNKSGVRVSLICNSDTCTTGTKKNTTIASITFPVTTDFVDKSISVPLVGTGDDRHYILGVSVDKGSEAYFDLISLKNAAGKEFAVNGDFANTVNGSVTTKQPASWGEGDNRIGYYYGSLVDENTVIGTGTSGTTGSTTTVTGPTPTPGKAAEMSLTMKIKLQGITKKPKVADPITIQVKVAGNGVQATGSAAFTVDDTGIWTGKVDSDKVPTGGGYKIYVKAPKHIQKKICVSTPTEDKGGMYHCGDGAIVLAAGANTLDFSKILQLAGDLPEAGGKQNGIVDAYDTTFIRTNLGSTDATKLKTGDLNLDGIIDTQDYSMVLQSLSIKYDEE